MSSATSIRAKLYNLSKEKGIDFQNIAIRYFHERLLYRISISDYKDIFLLKGGNWIYATQGITSRPTTDIDLLAQDKARDMENIISLFREVLVTELNDGIVFFIETMKTTIIAEQKKYPGIRVSLLASLDSIKQSIIIDIGFGDIVTPNPIQIDFPVLLATMPTPTIWAYNMETVIAEKFHAMVSLGSINSRMKDIFDIYLLLNTKVVDNEHLKNAIHTTFNARETRLNHDAIIFTESYRKDAQKEKQWRQYQKKIKSDLQVSFEEAIESITAQLNIFLQK
jgi:predicted nucleotidyltransferase component of viral defense system